MKSTFSNRFFPKSRNYAKRFIVLAFILFSSLLSLSAKGELNPGDLDNIESLLIQLNNNVRGNSPDDATRYLLQLSEIGIDLQPTFEKSLQLNVSEEDSLPLWGNILAWLITGQYKPTGSVANHFSNTRTLYQQLQDLQSAIEGLSPGSSSPPSVNVVVTNVVGDTTVIVTNVVQSGSSGSPDILAGNPWWATNSAFVLSLQNLSHVYPQDAAQNAGLFSFPEFLSAWSGRLQSPYSRPTDAQLKDRYNWWGLNAYLNQSSVSEKINRNFTWFDLIADWMSSNSLASTSRHTDLIKLLRNISNELNDSSAYIANHLDSSLGDSNFYLSNIVNVLSGISPDILAGNPWWATNSGFNLDYYNLSRNGAFPLSPSGFYSFPQLMSFLSATYYQPYISDYPFDTSDFDRWGIGGANWKNGVYTFFDWLADYYKSNLVLNTSASYSNLLSEVSQFDTSDDSNPTNVPLPEYSLPVADIVPGSHDTLTSAEYGLMDKIESMQPNYTGGDDEIIVIPSFSVGGINVPEYRARLGTTITPVCRRVASFIWYVGLFAFLFAFAKSEFVYYATLGKFWVHKG